MAARRRSAITALGLGAVLLAAGSAAGQTPAPGQPGGSLPPISLPQVTNSAPALPSQAPTSTGPATVPSIPAVPPQPVPFPDQGPPSAVVGPITTMPVGNPIAPNGQRFNFKIDPKAQTKDLLPAPPAAKAPTGPLLTDDLTKVPEIDFQARAEKATPGDAKFIEQAAHQIAKINHVNAKKTDAFMTALIENRPDLAGMPFAMGDDCRTSGERAKQFTIAVNTVRNALGANRGNIVFTNFIPNPPNGPPVQQFVPAGGQQPGLAQPAQQQLQLPGGPVPGGDFWKQYASLCESEDAARTRPNKELAEHVTLARIAALMQMLAPETAELRLGLVKYLTAVPHVEATRALAKMAIFSAEEDVRTAAIEALRVRREKDYTEILVKGLRYPLPAVAKRTADAIARAGRTDLIPELVAVLGEDDPRMPTGEANNKKVRELVRVNHHRNCIMCHAPGTPNTVTGGAITAEVAVPGQPLPSPFEGYRQSTPDIMIRVDVTYLRQDFSVMMSVSDAQPWPEMQRFDFMVRERKLTTDEAAAYWDKMPPKEPGVLSPYHKAAVAALRELTGKDTTPTAEAWKKLLDLPAKTSPTKAEPGR